MNVTQRVRVFPILTQSKVCYEHNYAFRIIYSFHITLFFFVSGFLANRGKFNSNVIAKRAYQLLIPFVMWALIKYKRSFDINRALQILIYPDKGLWFLYNLFIYSALFNIAEWLEEQYNDKSYRYNRRVYSGTLIGDVLVPYKV